MQKTIKLVSTYLLVSTIIVTGLSFCLNAQAEEIEASDEVILDQEVSAQDLEVKDPWLLPDSSFYFLKNWGRGIRSFFTFDSLRKAELKSRFANERLIEIKKMVTENKSSEIIEKATEAYEEEVERIKEMAEKIEEKAKDNPEISNFLDKLSKHQILHHKILEKLETQVPEEAIQKIREAREEHLRRFGEIMTKLEDRKDQIRARLERGIQEIEGSEFKDFKNLEILKELEERFPNETKETIQKMQEDLLKKLQESLEETSVHNQEKFQKYIEKIDGNRKIHIHILEELEAETEESPETPESLQLKNRLREIKASPKMNSNE